MLKCAPVAHQPVCVPTEVADAPLRRLTIPLDIPPSEAAMLQAPQPLLPDDSCYGSFFDFPALHPKNRGKEYR